MYGIQRTRPVQASLVGGGARNRGQSSQLSKEAISRPVPSWPIAKILTRRIGVMDLMWWDFSEFRPPMKTFHARPTGGARHMRRRLREHIGSARKGSRERAEVLVPLGC